MLDPVQREALSIARKGGIEVSGGPGTGKSRLANALAADAAARGLTCLLVGDDSGLGTRLDVQGHMPIQQILSQRLRSAIGAAAAPGLPSDPVAMRASVFPQEAALARRLIDRSREIQAEHGFAAGEVAAAASRRMPSPKTMALIAVACADAAVVADALWGGNARPGRTMADVATAVSGGVGAPPADEHALVAARGGDGFEGLVRELEGDADVAAAAAGLDDLRRALDPWAWGNPHSTVSELHTSLSERAAAFIAAASLLKEHGTMALAARACPPNGNPGLALANYGRSYPGVDGRDAEAAIRRHAIREEGRSDAVAPFLPVHGNTRLADVEAAVPRTSRGDVSQALIEELRSVRDAAERLSAMLADLRQSLPPAALDVVRGKPIDDVAAGIAHASAETERTRALREMAGLRGAFSKTGFGDLMTAGPELDRSLAAARELDDAPRLAPASPRMLDLLLGDGRGAKGSERDWPVSVRRWQPATSPMPETDARWDVIVVDDASSLDDGDLASLRGMTANLHLVGVDRGAAIDLKVPHRSLCGPLANLGRPEAELGWAGGPGGSGVVVRTLAEGTDLEDARRTALLAVRAAGMTAVDAKAEAGAADVVVLAMDTVAEADIVAVAARARSAVLVLARECAYEPPAAPTVEVPADEAHIVAAGWTLVANALDGRVYAKDDRSVIVTDEPDGFGVVHENVADRVARLSSAGWSPIVAWRGSPRGAEDMLRLVERRAVTNGSHLDMELATFTLPGPGTLRLSPVTPAVEAARPRSLSPEDVPASKHRPGSFLDTVWRLKWIREEVLLKANPDRSACLLSDERITGLIRMGIDEEAVWQAKVRGALLRGVDHRQLAVRETVMDIIAEMPRTGVRRETVSLVAGVAYGPTSGSLDVFGAEDHRPNGARAYMVAPDATADAPAQRM